MQSSNPLGAALGLRDRDKLRDHPTLHLREQAWPLFRWATPSGPLPSRPRTGQKSLNSSAKLRARMSQQSPKVLHFRGIFSDGGEAKHVCMGARPRRSTGYFLGMVTDTRLVVIAGDKK